MATPKPVASLKMVTLDCGDPATSAQFWSKVLGWDQPYADDNYAMLTGPDHALGFGRVEGYQPPTWPNTLRCRTSKPPRKPASSWARPCPPTSPGKASGECSWTRPGTPSASPAPTPGARQTRNRPRTGATNLGGVTPRQMSPIR